MSLILKNEVNQHCLYTQDTETMDVVTERKQEIIQITQKTNEHRNNILHHTPQNYCIY